MKLTARGVEMKKQDFNKLVTSVRQAGQIRRKEIKPGRVFRYRPADIKAIREKLGKSQPEFALMIGVSVATLRNWEQGRRNPEGPARALLRIAEKNPEALVEALGV
jgi:putative transcriptional regulator